MRAPSIFFGLALAAALACSDDDTQRPADPATGDYTAVQLTTTTGAIVTDHIAEGATMTLRLADGGATSGHLFVPGAGEGGSDADLDLSGTWEQSGNRVTFDFADTDVFVDDVAFTYTDGVLSADATFADTRVQVTLIQDAPVE